MFDFEKIKEDAISDLCKLLEYKTVLDKYEPLSNEPFGKANKEALEFLTALAIKDGFRVKNTDNYAMHIEYGPENAELLGVLAHVDVVPTSDKWASDPFKASIRDGRIYARGTMDNKGPLIASYYALKLIKESNLKVSKRVRLICGCDEESGFRCLTHYFKSEEMPSIGFSPDADFPLIYGEKGNCHFDITGRLTNNSIIKELKSGQRYNIVPDLAKMKLKMDLKKEYIEFLNRNGYQGEINDDTYIAYGISAHAMHPKKGLNASFILLSFIHENAPCELTNFLSKYILFDYNGNSFNINYQDQYLGELTMNLGIVNIEDNNIKLCFDCRIPVSNIKEDMTSKINKALIEYPSLNVNFGRFGDVHFVDPNSELVRTLMDVYAKCTNDYESKEFTIGGGTYAKFIKNAVAYGPLFPGREEIVHQDDEYIIIDDFFKMIEIYTKAIYELIK